MVEAGTVNSAVSVSPSISVDLLLMDAIPLAFSEREASKSNMNDVSLRSTVTFSKILVSNELEL